VTDPASSTPAGPAAVDDQGHPRKWWILLAVSFGMFMALLVYRSDIAESFQWPFYVASLAALIAVVPALLTGRRLGEHEGHQEMTRGERLAAAGRAEADQAGEPLTDAEAWADGPGGRTGGT
jgi:hypothetical protein